MAGTIGDYVVIGLAFIGAGVGMTAGQVAGALAGLGIGMLFGLIIDDIFGW